VGTAGTAGSGCAGSRPVRPVRPAEGFVGLPGPLPGPSGPARTTRTASRTTRTASRTTRTTRTASGPAGPRRQRAERGPLTPGSSCMRVCVESEGPSPLGIRVSVQIPRGLGPRRACRFHVGARYGTDFPGKKEQKAPISEDPESEAPTPLSRGGPRGFLVMVPHDQNSKFQKIITNLSSKDSLKLGICIALKLKILVLESPNIRVP
jgi:hypothetical protein